MYESKMREARSKIKLADLCIEIMKTRRTVTGGYMFEIAGENKNAKADLLAVKLRKAIGGDGTRIARPCKMAEMRVKDLDILISPEEVRTALAEKGQCNRDEIKVGDVKRVPNELGNLWVKCPLTSASKIAVGEKIRVGWTALRVEVLTECFKCLEGGHVASRCPNKADHCGRCYRCGEMGFLARVHKRSALCCVRRKQAPGKPPCGERCMPGS